MIAGVLEIQIMANLARVQKDMDDAKRAVGGAMADIDKMAAQARGALGAIGGALSVGAFVGFIQGAIDAADSINDLSKSTGIAVDQLAGLKLASQQSGGDLDGTAKAINKLSQSIGKDAEKFAQIGVTAKDPLEAFKQLADLFVKIDDPQMRAALGAEALGKSWASAAPLLAEGGSKIQEMVDKGILLSGMTQETADKADEFNDRLAELKTAIGGTATQIATGMLPLLTAMAEDTTDVARGVNSMDSEFSPLTETLRAIIILGGNVGFVFRAMGIEIGGIAAQLAAMASGDFKAAFAIGDLMKEDAEKNRAAFDTWEARMLNAGKVAKETAKATKEAGKGLSASERAAIKGFVSDGGGKKETDPLDGLLENYRRDALAQEVGLAPSTVKEIEMLGEMIARNKISVLEYNQLLDTVLGKDSVLKKEQADADKASNLIADYQRSNALILERIQREADLATMSERQQVVAQALYKTEDDGQKIRERIIRDITDEAEATRLLAAADAMLAVQKEAVAAATAKSYDEQRTFESGWKKAFQSYEDSASNAAKTAQDAFAGMSNAMEGAVRSFVKNGKVDFKSFGDSVINTLIDVQMQSLRTNVLAPLMKGATGGAMDWLSETGIFAAPGSSNAGPTMGGAAGMFSGLLNLLPKFDVGTPYVPFDMPAIIHKGERIIPAAQNYEGAQSGGGSVSQTLNFYGPADEKQVRRAAGQGAREALAAFNGAGRYA